MLRSALAMAAALVVAMGCSVSLTGPAGGHVKSKKPGAQKPSATEEASTTEQPAGAAQNLGELPPVETVVNDLRVPSARETAARTFVGLNTLSFLANESGDNAKAKEYSAAAATALKAEEAKYDSTCKGYNCDNHFLTLCRNTVYPNDDFRGQIADSYLSSARKQVLLAKFKDPKKQMFMWRDILEYHSKKRFEPQGTAKTWCSDEPASKAPTVSAVPPSSQMADADTSAAKGKEAGTDMTAFGLALGEELDLPPCAANRVHQICRARYTVGTGDIGSVNAAQAASDKWLERVDGLDQPHDIQLAKTKCPDFVSSCSATALVRRGKLVQVKLRLMRDKAINANIVGVLSRKYKIAPVSKETKRCQNEYGAQSTAALHEWAVPGIHATLVIDDCTPRGLIEFEPNYYYLKIETETHHGARAKKEQAIEAGKPTL